MSRAGWATVPLGAAARRVPWLAIGAAGGFGTALVLARPGQWAASDATLLVRMTTVLIAAATATCLDDDAESLTLTMPFGRQRRRLLALALAGSVAGLSWSVLLGALALTSADPGPMTTVPVAGLAVELVAVLTLGWLVATATIRLGRMKRVSAHIALGVVACVVASLAHPRSIGWLWTVTGEAWDPPHRHWVAVAVVGALAALAIGRDPSRPARVRGGRSR